MDGRIDWKELLKYAIPVVLAAGVGAKIVRREKRLKEFNDKFLKPLQDEAKVWNAATSYLQTAVGDIDIYSETYYNKGKGGFFKPTPAKQGSPMSYKHTPDPVKAKESLDKAVEELSKAKATLVLDKDNLVTKLGAISSELTTAKEFRGTQKRITEALQECRNVRDDYKWKVDEMEKKRNTYVKLLS